MPGHKDNRYLARNGNLLSDVQIYSTTIPKLLDSATHDLEFAF